MATIRNQVRCTAIASYLCLIMGLLNTWPSSTINLFQSSRTPLTRQMTELEISLLGSLPSISSMISFPITGYLNDYWGRKKSCMLLASLQLLAWIIVSSCHTVEGVITAIFIGGLGGGIILVVPIYIGEISQKSIRGTMGAFIVAFMATGMIISHVLGGYLEYSTMNYVYLSLICLGLLMLNFLKESPVYLMKKGHEEEATKRVAYLRQTTTDSCEVEEEMESMRKILNPDFNATLLEEEQLKEKKKLSVFQFLKKSQSTRRALAVCLFLYTAIVFQGLVAIQMYARPFFIAAAPDIPATLASVLLVVMTLIASLIAASLMDMLGRRSLMISSSLGAGACSLALGTQIHLEWGPQWLIPLFMYMFCLIFFCGAGIVPNIVVVEVFLPEVKNFLIMLATEWMYICTFTILFVFNPLVSAIGLGPVFYIFSAICFTTAVVTNIFLPETKGLSVDVIQTKFEKQW